MNISLFKRLPAWLSLKHTVLSLTKATPSSIMGRNRVSCSGSHSARSRACSATVVSELSHVSMSSVTLLFVSELLSGVLRGEGRPMIAVDIACDACELHAPRMFDWTLRHHVENGDEPSVRLGRGELNARCIKRYGTSGVHTSAEGP